MAYQKVYVVGNTFFMFMIIDHICLILKQIYTQLFSARCISVCWQFYVSIYIFFQQDVFQFVDSFMYLFIYIYILLKIFVRVACFFCCYWDVISFQKCMDSAVENVFSSLHIEGSWPEWCISTIYHAWDTPLWSGTLDFSKNLKKICKYMKLLFLLSLFVLYYYLFLLSLFVLYYYLQCLDECLL